MGLFHGLIKDSPATFWINAGQGMKGRAKKMSGKRNRRVAKAVEAARAEYDREPANDIAFFANGAGYAVLFGVGLILGGYFLAGLTLAGIGGVVLYHLMKPRKGRHVA